MAQLDNSSEMDEGILRFAQKATATDVDTFKVGRIEVPSHDLQTWPSMRWYFRFFVANSNADTICSD
jgi:hypothetical protein